MESKIYFNEFEIKFQDNCCSHLGVKLVGFSENFNEELSSETLGVQKSNLFVFHFYFSSSIFLQCHPLIFCLILVFKIHINSNNNIFINL